MSTNRLLFTLSLLLSAYAVPVLAESAGLCALPPSDNPGILQAQQRLCGWSAPRAGLNTSTTPPVTAPVARAEAEEAFEEESEKKSSTDEAVSSVAPSEASNDGATEAEDFPPQEGSAQGSASGSLQREETQYTSSTFPMPRSEAVTGEGEEEFESFGPSVTAADEAPASTPPTSPRVEEEGAPTPRHETPSESLPSHPSSPVSQPKPPTLSQILSPVSQARLESLRKLTSKDATPSSFRKQETKDELLDRALRINSADKLTFDGTTKLQHQYLQALNSVSGVAGNHTQIMALVNGDDFLTLPQTQALRAYAALERVRLLEQHGSDCAETPDQRGCADLNKIRFAAGLPALS